MLGVVGDQASGLDSEKNGEDHENKTDKLVPENPCRFQDRRYYVPDEFPAVPDRLTLPHSTIVTKPAQRLPLVSSVDAKLPIE